MTFATIGQYPGAWRVVQWVTHCDPARLLGCLDQIVESNRIFGCDDRVVDRRTTIQQSFCDLNSGRIGDINDIFVQHLELGSQEVRSWVAQIYIVGDSWNDRAREAGAIDAQTFGEGQSRLALN